MNDFATRNDDSGPHGREARSGDPDTERASEGAGGEVSSVSGMTDTDPSTPIQPSDATAGGPASDEDPVDEDPIAPTAKTESADSADAGLAEDDDLDPAPTDQESPR